MADQTRDADAGVCTYTAQGAEFNPTATGDNCSILSVTNNLTGTNTLAGYVFDLGTTGVTWTITDGSGNTAQCSYDVTVNDTQDPTISCVADQTRDADAGVCTYTAQGAEFNPTATGDNCSILNVTNNLTGTNTLAGYVFDLGTTGVTWTITDGSGNTAQCSYDVTVNETQDPTISCVADQTRDADAGVCTYTAQGAEFNPTATGDNCSILSVTNNLTGTNTLAGYVFDLGTTGVTWTITDGSGNTAQCSYDVTVNDTQDPTISCVADQTRDADAGVCTYTAQGAEFNPTATGSNFSILSVTNNLTGTNTLAGYVFDLGTTGVTWTITDGSGNPAQCSYDVTVNDTQDPTISCVADQTRDADAGVCTYTAQGAEFNPTATGDNCSILSVTNNLTGTNTLAGYVFDLGTTGVTWTITDGSGNTAQCSYDVTVMTPRIRRSAVWLTRPGMPMPGYAPTRPRAQNLIPPPRETTVRSSV